MPLLVGPSGAGNATTRFARRRRIAAGAAMRRALGRGDGSSLAGGCSDGGMGAPLIARVPPPPPPPCARVLSPAVGHGGGELDGADDNDAATRGALRVAIDGARVGGAGGGGSVARRRWLPRWLPCLAGTGAVGGVAAAASRGLFVPAPFARLATFARAAAESRRRSTHDARA